MASFGANFNLEHQSRTNVSNILADRRSVAPVIDTRFMHLFAKRWGWYSSLRFKIAGRNNATVREQLLRPFESEYYINASASEESNAPSLYIDCGGVYRIEYPRWAIYPRLGVGVNSFYSNYVDGELKRKDSNQLYYAKFFCSNGDSFVENEPMERVVFCLALGVTVNYKLSSKCNLFFDISYQQPISSAKSGYIKRDLYTSEIVEQSSFKSHTIGRDLNISVGVSIPFGYSCKKK